jgi:peptidoglycan hydrolase CwlO-like protein
MTKLEELAKAIAENEREMVALDTHLNKCEEACDAVASKAHQLYNKERSVVNSERAKLHTEKKLLFAQVAALV